MMSIVPGGFEPPSAGPKPSRIDLYPTGLSLTGKTSVGPTRFERMIPAV